MLEDRLVLERKGRYRRTLCQAAEVLGGLPRLADYLQVSERELASWLEGTDMPPVWAFLSCIQLTIHPGRSVNAVYKNAAPRRSPHLAE